MHVCHALTPFLISGRYLYHPCGIFAGVGRKPSSLDSQDHLLGALHSS